MNCEGFKKLWQDEEKRAVTGWDFSCLQSRWRHEPLEWDYKTIVKNYLRDQDLLLDMGTGGGEFLLTLEHPLEKTSVTEAWPPNIELCAKRLVPRGIRLYPVEDDNRLPIENNSFDIVINRHEAYVLSEVSRILKPGGLFITQQVGGDNCESLVRRVITSNAPPLYEGFSLATERPKFYEHGFEILSTNENYTELKFFDVGAVVFFAGVIEWSFPGFSVESCFDNLCALQHELENTGFISTSEHRFVLVARRA